MGLGNIDLNLASQVISQNYEDLFGSRAQAQSASSTFNVAHGASTNRLDETSHGKVPKETATQQFQRAHDIMLYNIIKMLDHPESLNMDELEAYVATRELLSYAITNPEVAQEIVNLSEDEYGPETQPSRNDFKELFRLKAQKPDSNFKPFGTVVQLDDPKFERSFGGLSHADIVKGSLASQYFSHSLTLDVAHNTMSTREFSVGGSLEYLKEMIKHGKDVGAIVIPRGIGNEDYQNILAEVGMQGQITRYNTEEAMPKLMGAIKNRIPSLERELNNVDSSRYKDIADVRTALNKKEKEKASVVGAGLSTAQIDQQVTELKRQYNSFSPQFRQEFETYDKKSTNLVLMKEIAHVHKEVDEIMTLGRQGYNIPPIIVSAGNEADQHPDYVNLYACHKDMVVVGAYADTARTKMANFSGKGTNVDISEYSEVTLNNINKNVRGTSFAAPMLAEDCAWISKMGIPVASKGKGDMNINTILRRPDFYQKWNQFKQEAAGGQWTPQNQNAALDKVTNTHNKEEQAKMFAQHREIFDRIFSAPPQVASTTTDLGQGTLSRAWNKTTNYISNLTSGEKEHPTTQTQQTSPSHSLTISESVRNVAKYFNS